MESLKALLAAAETGSFTGAAERLGVTHGSISRRIAALEDWLGTTVFERLGRGVRPTPAGQRFIADASQAMALLSRSADQWRPWRGRQSVRVSVVPSFAKLWLVQRVRALECQDIHLDIVMDHRVSDLDAREADIAIRYGTGAFEGVDATLLLQETLTPAAAAPAAERLGSNPSSADLMSLPLLHDSDIGQWRAWLMQEDVRYQPRWQDRRFEDYDMVLSAAEAGLGVALLRLPLAQSWLDEKRLVRLATRALTNPRAHYLCTRQGEARPAVLALRERIASAE